MASADMTQAQIEALWDQAGGNPAMAPLMSAIAEVESSGRPGAVSPTGATGIWQIEWPLYANFVPGATSQQALEDPATNAAAAVKLSGNDPSTAPGSPVYDNWVRWEGSDSNGQPRYLDYLPAGPTPTNVGAATTPGSSVFDAIAGGSPPTAASAATPGAQGTLSGFSWSDLNPVTWYDQVTGIASDIGDSGSAVVDLFAFLTAPGTWIRFGEIVLGGLMVVGGGTVLVFVLAGKGRPPRIPNPVKAVRASASKAQDQADNYAWRNRPNQAELRRKYLADRTARTVTVDELERSPARKVATDDEIGVF